MLSRRARAVVAELLQDDLDRDGQPSGRHTLAQVAGWPDEIRGTAADHPHWHYDNRPVCDEGRERSWCAQGECATAQLQANLDIVADTGRSRAERNAALKWVVHLVGDLHQPLHEVGFAEGGNRIHLARAHRRHEHSPPSLHAYWDTRLVDLVLHTEDGRVPDRSLRRLEAVARSLPAERTGAPEETWAGESNALARSIALGWEGESCALAHTDGAPLTLSSDYVRSALPVVQDQLALAGARLAVLLDRALGQ
jgi:hypothetical protein